MLIHVPKLVSKEQVSHIKTILKEGDYSDGKLTAGEQAVKVKNNLQLISESEVGAQANKYLRQIVITDTRFWNLTFFNEILPFNFSLYGKGMHYGPHLDNPVMHNAQFRTDISMTIHLNEPDEYQGGELTIQSDYGVHKCKAEAGDAIIYPSNLLHEVKPVIAGERLVAITWVQSGIRDPAQRRILLDLINTLSTLENDNHRLSIQGCFNNLLRMWLNS